MPHLRSLATVSGFTAVSRVLGFLRDVLIAQFVSARVTDAFFMAFRFPNMFRRIFGEGAFNAAFVPLFARRLEQDGKDAALRFGDHTFSILAIVLGVFTLLSLPAMPLIMSVVAPGFKAKEDTGWIAPTDTAAEVGPTTVNVGAAKEIWFLLEQKGFPESTSPVVELYQGALLDREGKSSALESVLPALPVNGDGALVLPVPGQARFELPENHAFEEMRFQPRLRWDSSAFPEGEIRLRVFRNHPDTFPLTVKLSRITVTYLLCMALAAHLSGVLNTMHIFGMPAAAPVFLNVIFLIGITCFVPWLGHGGEVLAWCVFVAGFVQLGALWITCWRKGYPIRLVKPVFSPEMKRLFILMGPGILSAGIQQINLFIGSAIASFQENAVTHLYYAERVYQLPLGMVGIAFGVVLLPEISRSLRSGRDEAAHHSLNRGIEYSLLITLPAAVALFVIAYPIISGIFDLGGEFDASDSVSTAMALSAFAIGLPGYVMIKVLQPGYYAREDTTTPMKVAAVTVATNVVLSLILFLVLRRQGAGHVGIALATSIAAWVNVTLLALGLRSRRFLRLDPEVRRRIVKSIIASLLMGVLLFALHRALDGFMAAGKWQALLGLSVLIAVGFFSYAASAITLGATNLTDLRRSFRRS